jgi:hypothetical protein
MNPETKKHLFIAGAALLAGGASLPLLAKVAGKTENLAGNAGPYIAPIGVMVVGGALAALVKNPIGVGIGAGLAGIGAYMTVATVQASAIAKQSAAGTHVSQPTFAPGSVSNIPAYQMDAQGNTHAVWADGTSRMIRRAQQSAGATPVPSAVGRIPMPPGMERQHRTWANIRG